MTYLSGFRAQHGKGAWPSLESCRAPVGERGRREPDEHEVRHQRHEHVRQHEVQLLHSPQSVRAQQRVTVQSRLLVECFPWLAPEATGPGERGQGPHTLPKFSPRLVHSALLLVKMPMPTCAERQTKSGHVLWMHMRRKLGYVNQRMQARRHGPPTSMPTFTKNPGSARSRSRKPLQDTAPLR